MPEFTNLPPLSLYIHIPWCVKKCPYCDFNSHTFEKAIPQQQYIEALIADLDQSLPLIWGRKINTIFIGGGTPSLIEPEYFEHLLQQVRARVPLHSQVEITLEANPGTTEASRFIGYREAGINRLSMGIQSFSNQKLTSLGRIHTSEQALAAFQQARQAGFDNINLDLMFALPEQDLAQARDDVDQLLALAPEHVSYYHLTMEPNTFFHSFPPTLPDEETAWDIHTMGIESLIKAGYQHYEVSAFAKPGKEAKHNINYWRFGDYLGIGAGAHSKLSYADSGSIERIVKQKHPQTYLKQVSQAEQTLSSNTLTTMEIAFEFFLNRLRLFQPFDETEFSTQTGLTFSLVQAGIEELIDNDLVEKVGEQYQLSDQGKNFLNVALEKLHSNLFAN